MSKRTGQFITMDELIEEVGSDAARFFFLMHAPETHMDFDLALAKEKSQKNPVYYAQYAYVRCGSILEKALGNPSTKLRVNSLDRTSTPLGFKGWLLILIQPNFRRSLKNNPDPSVNLIMTRVVFAGILFPPVKGIMFLKTA